MRLRRPRASYRLQSKLAVIHECEEESSAGTDPTSASVEEGSSPVTGAFPMQLRKIEVLIKDVDLYLQIPLQVMYPVNSAPKTTGRSIQSTDRKVTTDGVCQTPSTAEQDFHVRLTGTRSLTRRRQFGYRSKCPAPPLERELGSRIDYTWMCSPQGKRVADLTGDETLSSSRTKRARVSEAETSKSHSAGKSLDSWIAHCNLTYIVSTAAKVKSKSFSARAKEQRLQAAKAATLARRSWAFSSSMASILGMKADSKIDAGEKVDLVSTVKPVPLPVRTSSPRQRPVVKRSGNEADEQSSGTEGGDELSGREGSVVGRRRLGASFREHVKYLL